MVQTTLRSIDTRSVQNLVQEVRNFPRISNREARQLARLAQRGDRKARTSLFNSSMWYVINSALRYKNNLPDANLGDLIQDGSIGLLRAIDKYNPDMQSGFLTYAVVRIKESILSGLEMAPMIRLPHNSLTLKREIHRAENAFVLKNGFTPTVDDLVEMTGETYDHIYSITHLGIDSYDSEEYLNGEVFGDTDSVYKNSNDDNKETVTALLSILSEREKFIISKLFGLDGEEEMEIHEIATQLGLSYERVRQIKVKAINTMQQFSAA